MSSFSPGAMTAGIFAILLGLGGAYGVRQYMSQETPVAEQAGTVRIPIAAYDLPEGKRVHVNDILLMSMTREEIEERYGRIPYMTDPQTIATRTLMKPQRAGQPFLSTSFYPTGMGPGIADQLKPGHVAITIPVHEIAMVSGFAQPGSMVDIIFRSARPEITMTLLEKIEVLAVGPIANANSGPNPSTGMATVAVTSWQAQVLKAAERRGEMTMALRSANDSEFASASMNAPREHFTLDQLLGLPVGYRGRVMEMYHGGSRSQMIFDREPVYQRERQVPTPVAANPSQGQGAQSLSSYGTWRRGEEEASADPQRSSDRDGLRSLDSASLQRSVQSSP